MRNENHGQQVAIRDLLNDLKYTTMYFVWFLHVYNSAIMRHNFLLNSVLPTEASGINCRLIASDIPR